MKLVCECGDLFVGCLFYLRNRYRIQVGAERSACRSCKAADVIMDGGCWRRGGASGVAGTIGNGIVRLRERECFGAEHSRECGRAGVTSLAAARGIDAERVGQKSFLFQPGVQEVGCSAQDGYSFISKVDERRDAPSRVRAG